MVDWLHISEIFNRVFQPFSSTAASSLQFDMKLLSQFHNMKVVDCCFSPRARKQIEYCHLGYTVHEGREDVRELE